MKDNEKLRADARENRDRILEVARDALAKDPTVSLNFIAKAVGVGPGTLYRHFPSRESLVIGVYRREIDSLAKLAPALLASHQPLQALWMWCNQLAKSGRMKHGLADVLQTAISDRDTKAAFGSMTGAVRQLIDACEQSGEIQPGTNAEDFLLLLGFLWQIPPTAEGERRIKRLLAIVFQGLGAKNGETCGDVSD